MAPPHEIPPEPTAVTDALPAWVEREDVHQLAATYEASVRRERALINAREADDLVKVARALLAAAEDRLKAAVEQHETRITGEQVIQAELRGRMMRAWPDPALKTIRTPFADLTRRTAKKAIVRDDVDALHALERINPGLARKCVKGITWVDATLRSVLDLHGPLVNEHLTPLVELQETHTLAIKLTAVEAAAPEEA